MILLAYIAGVIGGLYYHKMYVKEWKAKIAEYEERLRGVETDENDSDHCIVFDFEEALRQKNDREVRKED